MAENVQKIRRGAVLVLAVNDAESLMMSRIAQALGIEQIRLRQEGQCISLDRERDILTRINFVAVPEVWVVKAPGPKTEEEIRRSGRRVVIIDRHCYPKMGLDRSRDACGLPLPSLLAQFLELSGVTEAELMSWGWDPALIRGLYRFAVEGLDGLYAFNYSKEQIEQVLNLRAMLMRHVQPDFGERLRTASLAWSGRATKNRVGICSAPSAAPIFDELMIIVDRLGYGDFVMIVVEHEERQIYLCNFGHEFSRYVTAAIKADWNVSGRVTSVDNFANPERWVKVDAIFNALREHDIMLSEKAMASRYREIGEF